MNNLFSIFDPSIVFLNLNLNWIRRFIILVVIPSSYWLLKRKRRWLIILIRKYLFKEFSLTLGSNKTPGLVYVFISVFLYIILNNFLGLFPYVFTSSSHLSFTVRLALPLWLGYIRYTTSLNFNSFLSHLVPLGTPYILIPFMVLIELVRRIIRPLTLSVRLAANMVAGHLLLVLISSPLVIVSWITIRIILIGLFLLTILELAVSIIQAYVFSTLISLYVIEVNSPKF